MAQPLGSGYVLEESIGRGATGEVWRGTATADGRPLAFKLLRPELLDDPGMVARFLQERTILTGIVHPNLVPVHDLVAEGSRLAIVMDLVDGPDLRRGLRERGTLPAAEALELVRHVLTGVAALHAADVVHRDLKPENIMLAPTQGGVVPRVTDYGTARLAAQSTLTRTTSIIGTPEYLAPELADGGDPVHASDVYSAGIVLYELLCGVTPFTGGHALAVLRRHTDSLPGRPGGVDDRVWSLVAAMLAKDPGARPTAAEAAHGCAVLAPTQQGVAALSPLSEPPAAVPDLQQTHVRAVSVGPATVPLTSTAGPRRGKRRAVLVSAAAVLVLALVAGAAVLLRPADGEPDAVRAGSAETLTSEPTAEPTSSRRASSSPSPRPTPSASPTAAAAVLPDTVGQTLATARTSLARVGATVEVVEQVDESATDGTVLAQDPPAGGAVPDTVRLTIARTAVSNFLSDLSTVAGSPGVGLTKVNGQSYPHSVYRDAYDDLDVEYDLSRAYRRLQTTLGLTDDSGSEAVVLMEIFGDGRKLTSQTLRLGQAVPVDLDVSNVLRLRLVATRTDGLGGGWSAVFADATVSGLPSEVPSPVATG